MTKKSEIENFWDFVGRFEDYIGSGIAKEHEPFVFAKIDSDQTQTAAAGTPDSAFLEYKELSDREKNSEWQRCCENMRDCRLCGLSSTRRSVVPGTAARKFDLLVIGDCPSAQEDFSGKNGGEAFGYLGKWLNSIGAVVGENAAYTSVLKCRPGSLAETDAREVEMCRPYLERQTAVASPKVILATGTLFLRRFLNSEEPLPAVRGRLFEYRSVPVIVTYDPQTVLERPDLRRPVWEDLKSVRRLLDNRLGNG